MVTSSPTSRSCCWIAWTTRWSKNGAVVSAIGLCRRRRLRRQAPLRRRIVAGPGDAFGPTEMRRRQHLPDRLLLAAKNAVDDALLVDGSRHGLADFRVVEGRAVRIEAQIGEALGQCRQRLDALRRFELSELVAIEADGEIRAARLEVGDACRAVRHGPEQHGWKRPLCAPIIIVALQCHGDAALPAFEAIRPAADRLQIEGVVADLLDHRFGTIESLTSWASSAG
jgi:hypothetical protein